MRVYQFVLAERIEPRDGIEPGVAPTFDAFNILAAYPASSLPGPVVFTSYTALEVGPDECERHIAALMEVRDPDGTNVSSVSHPLHVPRHREARPQLLGFVTQHAFEVKIDGDYAVSIKVAGAILFEAPLRIFQPKNQLV